MFNDKHYLAMLAIPVLLSMTIGFAGDVFAGALSSDLDRVDSEIEGTDEPDVLHDSKQHRESARQNRDSAIGQGGERDKQQEMRTAIETANYESFRTLIEGTPFADIMSQESFSVLVQEYHHRKGFSKGMHYDLR